IEVDETGKKSGRGTYLCYNVECLNIAIRKKILNKSLKQDIPLPILDELRRLFKKYI
ncbi:YlxR family protein, partial [Candidatus Infernicultor aquiphilus]